MVLVTADVYVHLCSFQLYMPLVAAGGVTELVPSKLVERHIQPYMLQAGTNMPYSTPFVRIAYMVEVTTTDTKVTESGCCVHFLIHVPDSCSY